MKKTKKIGHAILLAVVGSAMILWWTFKAGACLCVVLITAGVISAPFGGRRDG